MFVTPFSFFFVPFPSPTVVTILRKYWLYGFMGRARGGGIKGRKIGVGAKIQIIKSLEV